MALKRQVRVGNQWMYARDAWRTLEEARRVALAEERHERQHDLPFWRKYVFSTDHKVIGLQYGFTALCFLLFGFSLMLLMQLQLATPGKSWAILKILGESRAPGQGEACQEAGDEGQIEGSSVISSTFN